jgi:hypothetical protein
MTTKDDSDQGSERLNTIPPSGATDGIRYILDPEHKGNAVLDETHGRPDVLTEDPSLLDQKTPSVSPASDASGLADLAVDDVDAQLPDETPTVRGGQLATESKRGAY